MPRLLRLVAGAAVVLAVGLALVPADGPRDHGRAAATSTSPADGAQSGSAAGRPAPAPASGHQHDIDPVSAGLLVVDGIAALAVVVLLMRRPRRPAPVGR